MRSSAKCSKLWRTHVAILSSLTSITRVLAKVYYIHQSSSKSCLLYLDGLKSTILTSRLDWGGGWAQSSWPMSKYLSRLPYVECSTVGHIIAALIPTPSRLNIHCACFLRSLVCLTRDKFQGRDVYTTRPTLTVEPFVVENHRYAF